MAFSKFSALYLAVLAFAIGARAQGTDYTVVPIDEIDLNRAAVTLTASQRSKFPSAHYGFRWNDGDNATAKWRPQGIAGLGAGSRKFLGVTWYGRSQAGYTNRGARLSLVDVTDPGDVRYRHVLLVDESGKSFAGLHAGGLVYRNGNFHVPDTRDGARRVHVFPAAAIRAVPAADRDEFYNYGYIVHRASSYEVPIAPSFMSFDWDRDKVLVGTFDKCASKHRDSPGCLLRGGNRLAWYTLGETGAQGPSCAPFFSEMQGAASAVEGGHGVLWVASSYGRNNPSHLHIARFSPDDCYASNGGLDNYRALQYPPGLEDLHISLSSENLWMLTEFGPHEGRSNNRVVFATKRGRLMP